MNRALVIKELRECAPLAALAALLAAWMLYIATGGAMWPGAGSLWSARLPFVEDQDHYTRLIGIVGGLALLLGFKQTAWEDMRGTSYFLLHRPIDRRRVFLIKAVVGIVLVQLLGAAMIVIYGLWAATPGTHPSPFYWSMTLPSWRVWLVLPTVYLAAFLCGMRQARWYGSRLLPLVGCGFVALVLVIQPWLWAAAAGALLLAAICASSALDIARTRDF